MDVFNRGSAVRGSAVMMLAIGDLISGLKPVASLSMVLLARGLVDALPEVHAHLWILNPWAAGSATRSIG